MHSALLDGAHAFSEADTMLVRSRCVLRNRDRDFEAANSLCVFSAVCA